MKKLLKLFEQEAPAAPAQSFKDAFAAGRKTALAGGSKTFQWTDPKTNKTVTYGTDLKKPAAPAPAAANQATAAQTQTSNYAGGDKRTANARDANAAPPPAGFAGQTNTDAQPTQGTNTNTNIPTVASAPAPAASTEVDPSIGSGQNIGGQFAKAASDKAAQDSFAQISGMAPNIQPQAGPAEAPAAAAPAPAAPAAQTATSGIFSNPTIGTGNKDSGQAALPSKTYGGGYDPTKVQYAVDQPKDDPQAVKGGFGQSTNVRTDTPDQIAKRGPMGTTLPESELDEDLEELEEAFNDILRLSGLQINEKAPPGAKAERMVKHIKKGYAKDGKITPKEKSIAYATAWKAHKKSKVSESLMLEAGSNLEHIVTRFKHETKNFLNGADLDEDLYNALYDYYIDNGEMPYGVAKAREGDPFHWVSDHFADELESMGHSRQFQETVMPVMDDTLSELARLAGLSESRIEECGDMGMDQRDSMNISTNMSSDGTKSVTISAQGGDAEALIQMLKLAGMGHMGHDSHTEEPVVMVSNDDDEMMEYANDPNQEYHSVDSIIHQGTDLHRKKDMYPTGAKLGDNPMAEEVELDEELQSLLDSVLVREVDPQRPKGDTGQAEIFTADLGINPPSPNEGPVGGKSKPAAPAAPKAPTSPAIPRPGVKK